MAKIKHGHAHAGRATKAYKVWGDMLHRCRCESGRDYHYYGGRGITVCERWLDFRNFLADMGEPPSPRSKLERKENNGNYEPGNCRWATSREQARNRRSNVLLTYQGRTQTLVEWCEELGLKRTTVSMRIQEYGWSVDRALSTPARRLKPRKPLKRS